MRRIGFFYFALAWGLCTQAQTFQRAEEIVGLGNMSHTAGVAVADIDGDHDLDVFVVAKEDFDPEFPRTWSRLFRNDNNGKFTDITAEAGLRATYNYDEPDPGWEYGVKMGASWGDYDNDGFPDLLLTGYRRNRLYHNRGDGTFEDVSQQAGLAGEDSCYYSSALWWDMDRDGWLDLYLSKWGGCGANRMFHNQGDGTFTETTPYTGLGGGEEETWMSLPLDVNQDGRWDLYLANDFAENELFIQQADGTFTEQAEAYGANQHSSEMGMSIADYNRDGRYDIFITNITRNRLLVQNPDNTFSNLADEKGVKDTYWAWGARFGDMDLDGDEDLFVTTGYQNDNFFFPVLKTNFLYQNQHRQGLDGFTDISGASGLTENANSIAMEAFDYDNDGDLDVLVSNMDEELFFYENHLIGPEPYPYNWLAISLEGTTSNRDGLGAEALLYTSDGVFRRYYAGAGFLNQSLRPMHFGLGELTQVDSLVLLWPSGQKDVHTNIASNQYLYAVEGDRISTVFNTAYKVRGCTDPRSCTYNPDAVIDDGSCSYLPSYAIEGATQTGYVAEEVYTYPSQEGSRYRWQVEGGEILEGQGTAEVTIKWGVADTGHLSVQEFNGCESEVPVGLAVDLRFDQVSDDMGLARLWNEILLEAIRGDFARPTVHARNLFHASIVMYDAWAVYDDEAETYFLGKSHDTYTDPFEGFTSSEPKAQAREKTLSYAMYCLLGHRFQRSPGFSHTQELMDMLMADLELDTAFTQTGYQGGDAAALGNYLASSLMAFTLTDGAREEQGYFNAHYRPVNFPLAVLQPGNPDLKDPNRWQPLALEIFIDQSGNPRPGNTPAFLSPEWGDVTPFAMGPSNCQPYNRGGHAYQVYHDPGSPPLLDTTTLTPSSEQYQWGFSLVSIWGGHLDPGDGVMWDISPASIGNLGDVSALPTSFDTYPDFYQQLTGGDISKGWSQNPHTGQPYEPQMVPRGDYARVLAEFWADGPDSETPPGHWFVLLNTVSDHPLLEKKLGGEGSEMDPLEWEVKTYFILGGTMHDAAISAWSIKGWYDYIRPVSAIRYMAELGQSSDPSLPRYHPGGIPLVEGYVELIGEDDPMVGKQKQHLGKIKLYTWKGHRYIEDTEVDQAGVGWILAETWMPYQRPSFVTPPFAGYVSGHSTYSRAAAEVMTLITGDPFFPGGMGEFVAAKNDFLVFEEGPSRDIRLQWATYRDASDQCSLSRIWGGIHPPADDIPGRIIGAQIGKDAYAFALPYFTGEVNPILAKPTEVFPNPISEEEVLTIRNATADQSYQLLDMQGRSVNLQPVMFHPEAHCASLNMQGLVPGIYFLTTGEKTWKISVY